MQPILNIALRAARSAGENIVRASENMDRVKIEEKSLNDFVSDVDRGAEKELAYHIKKAFPSHKIISEEGGVIEEGDGTSDIEWIIDPLDGTTNFLRGVPHYAISIAIRQKGRIEHAVVLDPFRREEFTASRGRGAQLNGRRIRVTERKNFDGALIGTGIPFKGHQDQHMMAYLASMAAVAPKVAGIRRAGSAALDLAYVAAGRFDGFWEIGLRPWDIAAGALLVLEAGGLVSDVNGGNDFLASGNIVAGNPKVFKSLLSAVGPHLSKV